MQILCAADDCPQYTDPDNELCPRCREGIAPPPATQERRLNSCTMCGYEAANRGLLSIHVEREHTDGAEEDAD
jgi:DNA-directed RNA polymerase subunit M/transcription elongation factor TFIIS